MVRYLDIQFPLTAIEKDVISIPFKIIYQTPNKAIESHIADKYPDLISAAAYTVEQLKRLLEMKREVKNSLTSADINHIHSIFYDKLFFDPFVLSDQISELKLTAYDCKMWTDSEPYLELNGVLTSNIDVMFQKLYLKRKLMVKKEKKAFKQTVTLKLTSHLPVIYIYDKPTFLFQYFFHDIFMKQLDKRGTFWNSKMRSLFHTKNFEKDSKEIELIGFDKIRIKILNFGTNIMNKLASNKLEAGVLGMLAVGFLRNRAAKSMYGEAAKDPGKSAVITYGRFNPVTKGHKVSFDYQVSYAKKIGADPIIYASPSEGDDKNPLKFSSKIKVLKELVPEYSKFFSSKKYTSFIDILVNLYKLGYKNVVVIIGDDRVKDIKRLAVQYNGIKGKAHGFYKFDTVKVISSGERKKGVSGTQMRAWAAEKNLEKFRNGLAGNATLAQAKNIMSMVRNKK